MIAAHHDALTVAEHGYAKRILASVSNLTVEEQMEEIHQRVVVGEYAGIGSEELDVLRREWQILFNRLYRLHSIH